MASLQICLFGVVRINHDGLPAIIEISRVAKSLLAYLILYRRRIHSREVLASLFWGDSSENRARSCLSTALWRLRKVLEPKDIPKGTYLATPSTGEVGFNRESNYWIDVEALENQAKHALAKPFEALEPEDVRELEKALKLYTGELLESLYDEWALRERERLRTLYLKSQAHLLRYYSHHELYERGLACGRKILDLEPLREEIHREMMRLYSKSGQRPLALRQYQTCCQILEKELDVPPMAETQTLRSQISRKTGEDRGQSLFQDELASAQQTHQQLQKALLLLDKASEQLSRSTRLLEKIFENYPALEKS